MWCSRAAEAGGDGGSGAVDRDGVSECSRRVELTSLATVAVAICGPIRSQRMWCSRAAESGGGGGSEAVDKDGASGCGAVELTSLAAVLAVEPSTSTVSVDVVQSS